MAMRAGLWLASPLAWFLMGGLALAQQITIQDVGVINPISCDFARYNYCQSEAALNTRSTFTPLSNPPANTIVHFAYRGPGNSNYLTWPTNFKASSANGISHQTTLAQYVQSFATGPWDQDFFFDGTNYIAETPGFIAASASSWDWVFTNHLAVDVFAYGFVQQPTISTDRLIYFGTSYLWAPTLSASVTLTIFSAGYYSGVVDLIEDSVGGHTVNFVPTSGASLIWATPTGQAPSLNTSPSAHNVLLFYAVSSTVTVAVPLGAPPPLAGSVVIGNSPLTAGQCSTGSVIITGAVLGNVVSVTPSVDPNGGLGAGNFFWEGIVTAKDTVAVKLCAITGGVPNSEIYNVRVQQ